jgi:hypothetical protein
MNAKNITNSNQSNHRINPFETRETVINTIGTREPLLTL